MNLSSLPHKGHLQHSLLAQSPLVCGKNVRIPFKRRELFQSENVHSGKPIPFPVREFSKCYLRPPPHTVKCSHKSRPLLKVVASHKLKNPKNPFFFKTQQSGSQIHQLQTHYLRLRIRPIPPAPNVCRLSDLRYSLLYLDPNAATFSHTKHVS